MTTAHGTVNAVTTGFYLLDNPNTTPQYRFPRREPLSGCVFVHDTESIMDDVGVDTGAENVAAFIVRRSDYGSYHEIVDSDSVVRMAPDDHETWHVAADRHNWHGWGISAACRTTDWHPDSAWTQLTIRSMGKRICEFWRRNGWDPVVNARWGDRSDALNRVPGLYHHGTVQPADRSDAWVRSPYRDELDRMLIDAVVAAAEPPAPPEDPLASAEQNILSAIAELERKLAEWERHTRQQVPAFAVKTSGDDRQWLVFPTADGLRRLHIADLAQRDLLIKAHVLADFPPVEVPVEALDDIPVV